MSSRTRSLITTDRTILRIAARAVTTLSALAIVSVPSAASAQTVLHACYVPGSGTVYRIKATNTGTFTVPPAYGEGMYDRGFNARSAAGGITVTAP